MKCTHLKFYVQEKRRVHGLLACEWIFDKTKKIGFHGGSAFRAIASFIRHGVMVEDHSIELDFDRSVEVDFAATDAAVNRTSTASCRKSHTPEAWKGEAP